MVLPECGDCHKCKEGLKCVEDVDSLPWSGKGVCMKGIICARNYWALTIDVTLNNM